MPRGRPRKVQEVEEAEEIEEAEMPVRPMSEKQRLLALHKTLTDLKVNRMSELENLIAKAED